MILFLKVLRLHNKSSHIAWASLSDDDSDIINITDPLLEKFLPLEKFLKQHSEDTIVTFDGEYLFGRYSHILNPVSIIGIDILFYLTEMKKFSIGSFIYRFNNLEIYDDVFFDHRSLNPQDVIDKDSITKYLNAYCQLTKRFLKENQEFIDSILCDTKLMDFYIRIQPNICENVYRFNSTRIEFDTSGKSTNKIIKGYENYITKIKRHGNHIYPNYYSLSIVTGRLGFFEELNPMVLPKEIRSLIIPSNDSIISFDAKNAEPRIVFELSDTPIEYDDVYEWIVKKMAEDSIDRKSAKSIWFNFVYGNEKMKNYSQIQKMSSMFPDIVSFINKIIGKSLNGSVMYSYFGRRLPKFSKDVHKIVSYYIQSTFSDYFQLIINNMFKKMESQNMKSKILCTIHDEFLLDLSDQEINDVMEIIRDSVQEISDEFGFSRDAIQFDTSVLNLKII